MPYTPAYAAGDVLTAAAMNSIGEAWSTQTYVANTSWKATTTDPVIGNGTWAAKYSQNNKLVTARYRLTMGSTTTYGSGAWRFALPVTASSSYAAGDIIGVSRPVDTSALRGWIGNAFIVSTTTIGIAVVSDGGILGPIEQSVTNADPTAWASGDVITIQVTYEAA